MINPKLSQQRSNANEAAVKAQFENLKYVVQRLDTRGANKPKRPDFLILNSAGPQMLCEVKTIDSAFYPRDKEKYGVEHVHISTLDDKFVGAFGTIPTDAKEKTNERLTEAVSQRAALIADHPGTADLPLLVVEGVPSPVADKLPPPSTHFVLVHNKAAIRLVPEDFARLCLPEDYYG